MITNEYSHLKNVLDNFLNECRSMIQTQKSISAWKKVTLENKESIVTSIDIEIEEIFSALILREFPKASIFGEECHTDASALKSEWCFVIDPIDGTKEFLAGSSNYAISIAVLHEGIVESSVLDFPAQNFRYWSTQGKGSCLNDSTIHVSEELNLEKFRIGISPSQSKLPIFSAYKERLKGAKLIPIGSLTSKVSAVARGSIDAAFYLDGADQTYALWDFAACKLILEEADGQFTDLNGNGITNTPVFKKSGWLATNRKCHQLLLDEINEAL